MESSKKVIQTYLQNRLTNLETYSCQTGNIGLNDKLGAWGLHTHTTIHKIGN